MDGSWMDGETERRIGYGGWRVRDGWIDGWMFVPATSLGILDE